MLQQGSGTATGAEGTVWVMGIIALPPLSFPAGYPGDPNAHEAELGGDPFSYLEGSCVGNITQKLVRLSEICQTTQSLLVTTF